MQLSPQWLCSCQYVTHMNYCQWEHKILKRFCIVWFIKFLQLVFWSYKKDLSPMVAHICHGKTYFSAAKLTFHGKTYFSTAKLSFPRKNLLFQGKTYFSTAKLTFPQQNLRFNGKTYFSRTKLTFPRQNLLFHGKTYFATTKLTFPQQNLCFNCKTYFFMAKLTFPQQNLLCSYFWLLVFSRYLDPGTFNCTRSNMADGKEEEDFM